MFKIAKAQTFEERVEVFFPAGNGQYTKGSFMATFERISEDEFRELPDDMSVARRVVKNVSGVAGDDDQELPSDEALEAVLNDTCCITAILSTYQNATRIKNLRRGN